MSIGTGWFAQVTGDVSSDFSPTDIWKLGLSLVALAVGVIAALWIRRLVLRVLLSVAATHGIAGIVANVAGLAVGAFAIAFSLYLLRLEQAAYPIIGVVILIGIALALGLQQILANYIAGIALAFRPLFQPGDVVEIENYQGTILNQNLRETTLRTFEGTSVTFPNRDIFFSKVINQGASGKRRIDIRFLAPAHLNLTSLHDACALAVSPLAFRDPARDVEVYFDAFSGTSVSVVVALWIDWKMPSDYLHAKSDAIHVIVMAVRQLEEDTKQDNLAT